MISFSDIQYTEVVIKQTYCHLGQKYIVLGIGGQVNAKR